jgi:nucleotide-binding universal stress UspA family protein
MARFVVGIETEADSERIAAYIADRATGDDEILVVNALAEEASETEDVKAGERAMEAVETNVGDLDVEKHHLIRGQDPADELLEFAADHDADEIIIGIHDRNPTGKVIFGSTANRILLNTTIPVVSVPIHD